MISRYVKFGGYYQGKQILNLAQQHNADFNKDGEINMTDANLIAKADAGLEAQDSSNLSGDVNMDGKVNIADALMIERYLKQVTDLSPQAQQNADVDKNGVINNADVNCDGKLDDDDISLISKYETKLIDALPVNQ